MKRFSKILAVLLTVCVLAGLIAVFASADTNDYREISNDTTCTVTTATQTWTVQTSDANYKIKDYKYAVVQYLLKGDDNGDYAAGITIKPSVSVSSSNFGTIQITKTSEATGDTPAVYSVSNSSGISGDASSIPLTSVPGDWNVITMVIVPTFKTTDVNGDGKFTVGDYASFSVYYYVNGTYLGVRTAGSAVDLGHVQGLVVTGASETTSSVTLGGYNARFYLNGLTASNNAYTTPNTYGIDDFIDSYASGDVTALQDVKYSKYSKTSDYPATTVGGVEHVQSGAKAYVGGVGYFNAADAFANIGDGDTVKVYDDVTVTSIADSAKSFTVEVYNGATVTFDDAITSIFTQGETTEITNGVTYTMTKQVVASVGGVNYYSVSEALGALEEGGTITFYADATVSGVSLDTFYVEADNATVTFDSAVISAYDIISGVRGTTNYYKATEKTAITGYTEITNNGDETLNPSGFASSGVRTWTSSTGGEYTGAPGALATSGSNSYWRANAYAVADATHARANGSYGWSIGTTPSGDVATDEDIYNFGYVATEYLFTAAGGNYADGAAIRINSHYKQTSGYAQHLGEVYVVKGTDGNWYASTAKDYSASNVNIPLSATEEWNVVTQLSVVTNADAENRKATVVTYIFVNGELLRTTTITDKVLGAMTELRLYGYKNSSATAGSVLSESRCSNTSNSRRDRAASSGWVSRSAFSASFAHFIYSK